MTNNLFIPATNHQTVSECDYKHTLSVLRKELIKQKTELVRLRNYEQLHGCQRKRQINKTSRIVEELSAVIKIINK